MAKTQNDEAYEAGVRDGMQGGFLDDVVQSYGKPLRFDFTERSSELSRIYDAGYKEGAAHRYDTPRDTRTDSPRTESKSESQNESSSRSDSSSSSYGGSDSYGSSSGTLDTSTGWSIGGEWLLGGFLILIGLACFWSMLGVQINRIYPSYETGSERFERQNQEWEQWVQFAKGPSDKFIVSKPTPDMPSGRIIFISENNSGSEIQIVDLRTKKLVSLPLGVKVTNLALSPDRKKIALTATQKNHQKASIFIINFNKPSKTQVIEARAVKGKSDFELAGVAWLSNSTILMTRQYDDSFQKIIWRAEIDNPSRCNMFIPTRQEYDREYREYSRQWHQWRGFPGASYMMKLYARHHPTISSDGKRLAFVKSNINGDDQIALKDLSDGKNFMGSGLNLLGSQMGAQAFSPDGTKIAFHFPCPGSEECLPSGSGEKFRKSLIGIIELGSWRCSWLSKICWLKTYGKNPAWSPDGKWIAFDNAEYIYLFEIDSGKIEDEARFRGCAKSVRMGNIIKITGIRGKMPLWVR